MNFGIESLPRAAVELAKQWRTDRMLRRLEAMLLVADREHVLLLSGAGDVIEPDPVAGGAAVGCHNSLVNLFGLGLKSGTAWNTTYDQSLAKTLQKYYGPGGTWWNTTPAASH